MYKHILVPIDGSACAERGLQEAIALATDQKARLTVLHVVDTFPLMVDMTAVVGYEAVRDAVRSEAESLLKRAQTLACAAGVPVQTMLREVTRQRVAEVVAEQARQGCDLIVMGTHGRRGLSRFALGSDAELVVRLAPVPVLLVRTAEPAE